MCCSQQRTMLSVGLVLLLTFAVTSGQGPEIKDLVSIQCPTEKPYICLPYGYCCRGDQFCHEGECLSCFPRDLSGEKLLDWCRDVGQYGEQMRHGSCRLACFFRFNASDLSVTEDCPARNLKKCPYGQCCQDDQYCNGRTCTSCFPNHLSELQLASLCREMVIGNDSLLEHPSCRPAACYTRFSPSQLTQVQDKIDPWMIAFFIMSALVAYLICYKHVDFWKRIRQRIAALDCKKPKPIKNDDIKFDTVSLSEDPPFNKQFHRSLSMEEKKSQRIDQSFSIEVQ